MKPNPSLPLYDMLADEVIEVLIEDKQLWDFDDALSYEIFLAWKINKAFAKR